MNTRIFGNSAKISARFLTFPFLLFQPHSTPRRGLFPFCVHSTLSDLPTDLDPHNYQKPACSKFLLVIRFFSFFFSCDRVQHRFFMGCADLKIGILTILNIAGSVAHWIKRENLLVQKIMDWKYTRFENLVGNVLTFPTSFQIWYISNPYKNLTVEFLSRMNPITTLTIILPHNYINYNFARFF